MKRALVVIDVQESFLQQEIWAASSHPKIVESVQRLVEHAREQGDLVVWVLHAAPGSGTVFDPALGFVRLMDGLHARDGEPVVTKSSHNAFTTTNLQQILTRQGVREVVVCGIRTEQCCETTARVASDLGYEVTFVVDATATTPIPHWKAPANRPLAEILADPLTLGTDEIIKRTVYALAGRFAVIRTVEEVVAPAPVGG
mgnify:CR=1 FL=1